MADQQSIFQILGIKREELPLSRKAAKELGAKYYLGPKGCKKSDLHVGVLRTHNSECYECHLESRKLAWQNMSPDRRAKLNENQRIRGRKKTQLANKARGFALRDTGARKVAMEQGLIVYFTGKPCPKGHQNPPRFTRNGECQLCSQNYAYERYHNKLKHDPEYIAENRRRVLIWQNNNPNKKNLNQSNYYRRHIEKILEYHASYRKENPDKIRDRQSDWAERNPEKIKSKAAKYRATIRNAMPDWASIEQIESIYMNCPEGFEVDHIAPLQSDVICGLHLPQNLQYLPLSINRSKGNKFPKFEMSYGINGIKLENSFLSEDLLK